MKLIRSIFLTPLLFILWGVTVLLFIAGFFVPIYFFIGQIFLFTVIGLLLIDIALLFSRGNQITVKRIYPHQCSLGEFHQVRIHLKNESATPFKLTVIDDSPEQLQMRNHQLFDSLDAFEEEEVSYVFQPKERGVFKFGNINLLITSVLRLATRKIIIPTNDEMMVYPSIYQMKQAELKVFSKVTLVEGIKKVRRLGHSNDFEQIRNYVQGDDYRKINWKATSRRNELMINQYEDEKAQQVYCIVDKSRAMQSVFNGLSLLDHAINSTLAFSNIAIRKSDRIGLMTFSDKIGTTLEAEKSATQLKKIMEVLYRQKTEFAESNYELMFSNVRKSIKGRSLLLLFTNFESNYSLMRRLAVLRKLNRSHVLVVIFFEDTELKSVDELPSKKLRDVYFKTVAGKMAMEKQLMILEMRKYGIQTVFTTPENLTNDTINKYLEIKSRGMI